MKLSVRKEQIPVLIVNVIVLAIFMIIFSSRQNWEFVAYIGVIAFFLLVILLTNHKVHYPNIILWGLTLWAFMHMSGGGIRIGEGILYNLIIFPLSTTYSILRYDQVVHMVGFGVATLLMYYLIKPILHPEHSARWVIFSIVIVMAGLGVGALNEIIEFLMTVILPETGVGGYVNTSLDLVSDLIGAIIAVIYINLKELK